MGNKMATNEQPQLPLLHGSGQNNVSSPVVNKVDNDLHSAAKTGDLDVVRALLDDKQNIAQLLAEPNQDKWIPLHFAVDNNHPTITGLLVDAMVEHGQLEMLNFKCSYPLLYGYRETWSALHIAVHRGHVDCIEKLARLDPTVADSRGYLPVHLAAESKRDGSLLPVFLETFPSFNDELNACNVYGLTPLMLSAATGSVEHVQLLVERGVKVEVSAPAEKAEIGGQNVLHVIVRRSVEEPNFAENFRAMYRALYTHNTVENLTDAMKQIGKCSFKPQFENQEMSAAEFGCAIGALALIRDMLKNDVIESNVELAVKCLRAAVAHGNAEITSFMVEKMAECGLSDHLDDKVPFQLKFGYKESWTALHVAAHRGHVECLKQLSKLNPAVTDKRDYRPIHLAAESKTRNTLETFVRTFSHRNDPELNAINSFGFSPLMLCAAIGNVDAVSTLVDHGASIELLVPEGSTRIEQAKRAKHVGQNVLHIIVRKSVEDPSNVEKFIEIYETLARPYVENNAVRSFNETVLQAPGTCSFKERFHDKKLTPLQFAAAIGAVDMLHAMVDTLLADKETSEQYCDLALRYLVPPGDLDKGKSCLELVSSHCSLAETVQMQRVQPMTEFVSKFARFRTALFLVLLAFHMTHMSLLTRIVTTSRENSINSTNDCSSMPSASVPFFTPLLLIWPFLLLIYEALCFVMFLMLSFTRRTEHDSVLPEESQYRIVYLDAFGHASTVIFSVLMLAWYIAGRHVDDNQCATFLARSHVSLTAALLVVGWLQTLEYVRCPYKLHTFVAILKLIFVKDVFYISMIYGFVLIGFAAGIYVYMLADLDLATEPMTFGDCVYRVYTTMLGDGSLFDSDMVASSESHAVRSVFSIYLCLSIIVLMNMLIAMMNSRYENVLDIRRSLWYIETVNSLAWFSRISCFRSRFGRFSAEIEKPVKLETSEDEMKRLHARISNIETALECLQNKLDRKLEQR